MEQRRRRGRAWFGVGVGLSVLGLGVAACGGSQSDEAKPPMVQGDNAYAGAGQPGAYTPPGQQAGQPAAPGVYQPPAPTQQPNALAPACTNDIICGTHRCNLQAGKCAFPCTSNLDCAAGFGCVGAGGPTAICTPGVQ
jgi:hypothetical protein